MPLTSKRIASNVQSEVRITTDTGVVVAAPEYPSPCHYLRLLRPDGTELAYWDAREWGDNPTEVVGAIVGRICEGL